MRLIDAEPLEEIMHRRCAQYSNDYGSLAGAISGCLKLVQAQPTVSTSPNDPLTLEELREMDGEPVWVVELNGYPPHWGLVYWCRKNKRNIVYITINNGASICAETFLAAGGKIYRRKPEEGGRHEMRQLQEA